RACRRSRPSSTRPPRSTARRCGMKSSRSRCRRSARCWSRSRCCWSSGGSTRSPSSMQSPRAARPPQPDHADPDLPAGFRQLPVQRGGCPVGAVLHRRGDHRRHLHQGHPLERGDGQMTTAGTSLERRPLAATGIAIAAIVLVVVCLFPFAWMALSSIKKLPELFTVPPHWLPNEPTLDNYATVFFHSNIPRYFLNSCIISGGATLFALALAVFAAYGFARFEFRGKAWLQTFVLVGQLLPTAAII